MLIPTMLIHICVHYIPIFISTSKKEKGLEALDENQDQDPDNIPDPNISGNHKKSLLNQTRETCNIKALEDVGPPEFNGTTDPTKRQSCKR